MSYVTVQSGKCFANGHFFIVSCGCVCGHECKGVVGTMFYIVTLKHEILLHPEHFGADIQVTSFFPLLQGFNQGSQISHFISQPFPPTLTVVVGASGGGSIHCAMLCVELRPHSANPARVQPSLE